MIVSGAHADGQLVIPVSDEPAFRIPVLVSAEAPAAFSPDGDTVYMAGWTEFGHGTAHLVALDLARPTEPLAQVVLGEWDPLDVAVDPLAPFLYIISAYDFFAKAFGITVIDRRTLEQVGQLDIPEGECGEGTWWIRLLLSRNDGALYVVQAEQGREPAYPSMIYRFDLVAP